MIGILISLVLGFCAGILGALVTNEAMLQKAEQRHRDERQKNEELAKTIEALQEHDRLEDVAMQTLIIRFKKERGAIWESLNALWNDYDKRQQDTQEGAKEGAEGAKEE